MSNHAICVFIFCIHLGVQIFASPIHDKERVKRQDIIFPTYDYADDYYEPRFLRRPGRQGGFNNQQMFSGNFPGFGPVNPNNGRPFNQGGGVVMPSPGGPGVVSGGFQMTATTTVAPANPTVTTAAPATTRTTPSESYLLCLQNCPSTQEYNPVCGDDAESYHNAARLSCSVRCGRDVRLVRPGLCVPRG